VITVAKIFRYWPVFKAIPLVTLTRAMLANQQHLGVHNTGRTKAIFTIKPLLSESYLQVDSSHNKHIKYLQTPPS